MKVDSEAFLSVGKPIILLYGRWIIGESIFRQLERRGMIFFLPGALKKRDSYSFQNFDVKYVLIFYIVNSMGSKKSAN